MTNKVKPFYIRITDDMTSQMVQDAFDKCVDAGAVAEECIADTNRKHSYQDEYGTNFNCFGVDDDNTTFLYDNHENYGIDAQEITLDQLDEWLEVEEEWKAGDRVTIRNPEGFGTWDEAEKYLGTNGTVMAVFTNTNSKKVAAVSHDDSVCICWMLSMLSKAETPEQKAEREKREAIDDIKSTIDFFVDSYMSALSLYEQGYRKQ